MSSLNLAVQSPYDAIQEWIKKGEDMLKVKFPERIRALNKLVQTESLKVSTYQHSLLSILPTGDIGPNLHLESELETELGDGKSIKESVLPSNNNILTLIDLLRPRFLDLDEDFKTLELWIQFQIPRIQDGNNFGVSVQEISLAKVLNVSKKCSLFQAQVAEYFLARGRIVAKLSKHPHVADFRLAATELDRKLLFLLWQKLRDIRNQYLIMYDYLNKNLEKIKLPRGTANHNFY
ncbi:PSME3 [Cordylochernes scorpioides]|uniref:PSME3 n=1 Tax=Cordylochernes scorpioides TaxID=51811 RepID=A0ABY6KVK8_9ARAC|nr:PSME3 [Cordylochernes scorpioides]